MKITSAIVGLGALIGVAACVQEQAGPSTSSAAVQPDGPPIDLAQLRGKRIEISYTNVATDGDVFTGMPATITFLGDKVLWNATWVGDDCWRRGAKLGANARMVYDPAQGTNSGTIPCEAAQTKSDDGSFSDYQPAQVTYKTRIAVAGNVLHLTGDAVARANFRDTHPGNVLPMYIDVAHEVTEHHSAKIRISGNTCSVLEFDANHVFNSRSDTYHLGSGQRMVPPTSIRAGTRGGKVASCKIVVFDDRG